MIQLDAQVKSLEARLKFMVEHGGQDGYADAVAKQNAVTAAIGAVEEFVDQRDVANLNLSAAESSSLTKLNLSKIVNNLRKKLTEQEAKNQRISLKLDQALKQKEIYKEKANEMKAQMAAGRGPARPRAPVAPAPTATQPARQERPRAPSFKERRAMQHQQ